MAFPAIVAAHGGTGTTTSVTIVAASAGNVLVLCGASQRSPAARTISSIASTNTTWSKIGNQANGVMDVELWLGVVAGGSSGTTVTVTMSGTGATVAFTVAEFSGVLVTGTILGATAVGATGSSVTPAIGSFTGLQKDSLLISVEAHANGTAPTATPGGSWVNLTFTGNSTVDGEQGAYVLDGTAANAQSASWTITSAVWATIVGELRSQTLTISVNDSSTVTESITEAVSAHLSVSDATSATTESANISEVWILSVNDSTAATNEAVTVSPPFFPPKLISVSDTSSVVDLASGYWMPNATWMQSISPATLAADSFLYNGGFVFCAANQPSAPSTLFKIDPSNPAGYSTLTFPNDGAHTRAERMVYVASTGKLYIIFASLLSSRALIIAEVDPSALTSTDLVTDTTHTYASVPGMGLVSDGANLYAVSSIVVGGIVEQALAVKFRISDGARLGELQFTLTGDVPYQGHSIVYDGTNLFAAGEITQNGSLGWVVQFTTGMSQTAINTLPGHSGGSSPALLNGSIWQFPDGTVLKIATSDLSYTTYATAESQANDGLFYDGAYLWGSTSLSRIVRFDPVALTAISIDVPTPPAGLGQYNVFSTDGAYLFVDTFGTLDYVVAFPLSVAQNTTQLKFGIVIDTGIDTILAIDVSTTTESVTLSIVAAGGLSINVNDSSTVSEAVTLAIITNASVNESSSISEDVSTIVIDLPSVSDSLTIAESAVLSEITQTSVVDSSTALESATIVSVDLLSVNDSSTASESISAVQLYQIVVNESSTVTENIALSQIGTGFFVVDASTVTESITEGVQVLSSVFDSSTITESVTDTAVDFISVFDSSTVAENISRTVVTVLSISDSSTVTEATSDVSEDIISVFDASTVAESISFTQTLAISVNDASAVAESVAISAPSALSVSDSATVTESVRQQIVSFVSVFDSSTGTESVSLVPVSGIGFLAVDDSSIFSEDVSFQLTTTFFLVDGVNVTEGITILFGGSGSGASLTEKTAMGMKQGTQQADILVGGFG